MPSRLFLASLLAVFTTTACSQTLVQDRRGAGGNPGGGGNGGDACQAVPDCPGAWYTDEDGCAVCDDSGSCDDCGANQICSICQSAGPTEYFCETEQTVEPGQFECKWLACAENAICIAGEPVGDGCEFAACEPLPSACPDRDCQCLMEHFGGFECEENEAGHITVHAGPYL